MGKYKELMNQHDFLQSTKFKIDLAMLENNHEHAKELIEKYIIEDPNDPITISYFLLTKWFFGKNH